MLTDRDFTVKQEQHQAQLEQAERMRLIKQLSQTEGGSTLLQRLRQLVQRPEACGPPCFVDEAA